MRAYSAPGPTWFMFLGRGQTAHRLTQVLVLTSWRRDPHDGSTGMQDNAHGSVPAVPWSTMGQPMFDRLIEALVDRRHSAPGDIVEVVDGRGGDGGVDIFVTTAAGKKIVYQLKYFHEGFDGPWKERRKQITKSFEKALVTRGDMDEWILVSPCQPTRSGWAWFNQLKTKRPGLTVEFVGLSRLEGRWIPEHPEVVHSVLYRDSALEQAKIWQRETAVLGGGLTDLYERHRNLDQVSRAADPHWSWQVVHDGVLPIAMLRANHAHAAERSPVSIDLTVQHDKADEDSVKFLRSLRFGITDPVKLPGRLIRDFEVNGPEIVRSGFAHGEIFEFFLGRYQESLEPRPFTLELTSSSGQTSTHRGQITDFVRGVAGSTMRQEFSNGAFTLTWFVPDDDAERASVSMAVAMGRADSTREAIPLTSLLLAWNQRVTVRMLTDGGTVWAMFGSLAGALDEELLETSKVVREFAQDLRAVEDRFSREFKLPEQISALDRIDLRVAKTLLEGHPVRCPYMPSIDATLTPEALDHIDLREDQPWVMIPPPADGESETWVVEAVRDQGPGAVVSLGSRLAWYFPAMYVEGVDEVIATLRRNENSPVRLVPRAGRLPTLYLPEHLQLGGELPNSKPWDLYGVDEPDG